MRIGLYARWLAMHGAPRAYLTTSARGGGDPLSALLVGRTNGHDPYPMMESIRARGPLVRTKSTWVTVDYGITREILRDNRFKVTPSSAVSLPRPLRALVERTDPAVANPIEPPAMVAVDPPDHTRYRKLVAHSFTPRAIAQLDTRVTEVTDALIDRIAGLPPQPDLIDDFATRLTLEIITELLGLPARSCPPGCCTGVTMRPPHCSTSGSAGGPTARPSTRCATPTRAA